MTVIRTCEYCGVSSDTLEGLCPSCNAALPPLPLRSTDNDTTSADETTFLQDLFAVEKAANAILESQSHVNELKKELARNEAAFLIRRNQQSKKLSLKAMLTLTVGLFLFFVLFDIIILPEGKGFMTILLGLPYLCIMGILIPVTRSSKPKTITNVIGDQYKRTLSAAEEKRNRLCKSPEITISFAIAKRLPSGDAFPEHADRLSNVQKRVALAREIMEVAKQEVE